MFDVLPILFILAGLAAIVVLMVRKLPQLRVLDVEALPEEKDRKKKEKLLEERFSRALLPWKGRLQKGWGVVAEYFERVRDWFRMYVSRVADRYRSEHGKVVKKRFFAQSSRDRQRQLHTLLDEADELRHNEHTVAAEEKYIAAIALSPKSVRAYKGLGKIYFVQEKLAEAKETFQFAAQLEPQDDIPLAFLGRIAKAQHRWEEALGYFQRALKLQPDVAKRWIDLAECCREMGDKDEQAKEGYLKARELEPRNPAVLDQVIQFAVKTRDKSLAQETLSQMQEVNPENQKLPELKEAVQEMR